jgi:histidine triad (HIT) family protein
MMARFRLTDEAQLAGKLAGWVFTHMSSALPVDRLLETSQWIAFYHPKPSYPLHILLVPKQAIANLSELDASDPGLLSGLVEIVQQLVKQFDLQSRGYRLITNGGPYQSIPQLHFHLISEK